MKFSRRTGVDSRLPAWRADLEQGRKRLRRLYVAAAAGLAALVPLILFAGFWVRSELNKSERDIATYLASQAATMSRRIDAEIEQQVAALRALSALPALDAPAENLTPLVERVAAEMPNWTAFAILDAVSGRPLATSRPDWPEGPALAGLQELRTTHKPRLTSISQQGDPLRLFLFVPVIRNNDVPLVLAAGYDGIELQRITARQGDESELLFTIFDPNNRILTRSRSPEAVVGQEAGPAYRDAVAGKRAGLFQTTSREGEPISSAFAKSDLTGWVAAASIDRAQVEKLASRSVWATIAAGVLSLVLAGILAVFIVHTVMERRVSDERLAASRALGELDARLLKTTQEALGEQRKASSEREVLLREIYHRVKNNLQIVQSLLRLGSRDLSPEQREPFESAVRRIGAMARVHTLLYNSPDLASIDFKDYLEELLKELSDGFGGEERHIESILDAHSMRVPLDTAVPLAFIAVELLTNSYRHAFPEGRQGRITVEVRRDEPFGTLRIEDNGVGLSREKASKRRLGLTIVRKLVQQIGGAIEEPQDGSASFLIRFPIEQAESASSPARPAGVPA